MKNIFIAIALLLAVTELTAQQNTLNQIDLLQQFRGDWECKLGSNTILNYEYKLFGSGLAGIIVVTAGGEIVDSAIQLFGYDAGKDVVSVAELVSASPGLEIKTLRFSTATSGIITSLDKDNPGTRIIFEFPNPQTMKQVAEMGKGYKVEMLFFRKDNK